PDLAQIDGVVRAIESSNKCTTSVCLILCHHLSMVIATEALERNGYSTVQPMAFHKQWKSDRVPRGGFTSSLLHGVVGFKRVSIMAHAFTPEGGVEYLQWTQN